MDDKADKPKVKVGEEMKKALVIIALIGLLTLTDAVNPKGFHRI